MKNNMITYIEINRNLTKLENYCLEIITFGNNFAKGENFITKATGNYFTALNNVVNVFND